MAEQQHQLIQPDLLPRLWFGVGIDGVRRRESTYTMYKWEEMPVINQELLDKKYTWLYPFPRGGGGYGVH